STSRRTRARRRRCRTGTPNQRFQGCCQCLNMRHPCENFSGKSNSLPAFTPPPGCTSPASSLIDTAEPGIQVNKPGSDWVQSLVLHNVLPPVRSALVGRQQKKGGTHEVLGPLLIFGSARLGMWLGGCLVVGAGECEP